MKRTAIALIIAVFLPLCVFSAQFHSVPLGHEAYRIIEIAEIRGAIPLQSDVKPYNYSTVQRLFDQILSSDSFSSSEKAEVKRVLSDLERAYGKVSEAKLSDLFTKGHVGTSGEKFSISVGGQVNIDMAAGLVLDGDKVLDSRNGGLAYVRGDILDVISYDLNFKLNFDKVDINAVIPTDLQLGTDGFYMTLLDFDSSEERLRKLPSSSFYLGIESFSEMSTSIKDDVIALRFGTVRRDWGPGLNSLQLSGSARAFDGLELSLKPTSWFNYSVAIGSLGHTSLKTVNGVDWPSENMDNKEGKYFNNLSIHRAELGPFGGFKFGIWESVVWRKRFELSYINPLSIYMFAQNSLGDYDNMLAGFDFSYNVNGVGRFYLALAMDEMNNPRIFTCPRNMLAYQLGAKLDLGFLDFSQLTVQATYVPAFFGAHYADSAAIFGGVKYTTAYVNKGQNIGYPLNPDSLELLARFQTNFAEGWSLDILAKEQMRSAQYSYKTTGSDVLTYMSYKGFYEGKYIDRDFFNNIWDNQLEVQMSAEKSLESFPMSISFGVRGIWDRSRDFVPTVETDTDEGFEYNPGKVVSFGEWTDTFTLAGILSVKIYY